MKFRHSNGPYMMICHLTFKNRQQEMGEINFKRLLKPISLNLPAW